ncbi:MAG: DNA-binding protein, partial [Flavobacteriales bacterium]|nr:DNA-binding protein [Flavobacteriales bacterium]
EKGEEIISDKKFKKREEKPAEKKEESSTDFTEVNFDDLGED